METSILDKVKSQYERYPYPKYSYLVKVDPTAACHGSFETGGALVHRQLLHHGGRRIGLFGCGTFEPYAQGVMHPDAKIDAVDLSHATLNRAKLRCTLRRVKNCRFHNEDLVSYSEKNPEAFDYIHSYGVLHHLPDPAKGFLAIRRALKPDGFCRIMVYSRQRRRMQLIQNSMRLLGIDAETPRAPQKVRDLLRCLPDAHPLKIAARLNRELAFDSGLIDACLHASEKSFDLESLKATLAQAGLFLHAWDFSQNTLTTLEETQGETLEEKMNFLDAFSQWPGSYTFWAAPFAPLPTTNSVFHTHPALRGYLKKEMGSTLLRCTLKLSQPDLVLLQQGLNRAMPDFHLKDSQFEKLKKARFMLELDP